MTAAAAWLTRALMLMREIEALTDIEWTGPSPMPGAPPEAGAIVVTGRHKDGWLITITHWTSPEGGACDGIISKNGTIVRLTRDAAERMYQRALAESHH